LTGGALQCDVARRAAELNQQESGPQGTPMRRVDILIGAVSVIFAGFVLAQALALDFFQRSEIPGPGFMPVLIAIAIGILGIIIIATRLVGNERQFGVFSWPSGREFGRSLTVWSAFTFSIALMEFLGFFVASAILIAVLLLGVERLRSAGAIATVILIPLVCYLLFHVALKVSLPVGPWGF
jgi:putative tricarboxylic transport membrane protein